MGDKVAILGTVLNSRIVVPFQDQSWDVWCCSGGNSQQAAPPRINEWFELHALVDLHSHEHQGWYPPYIEWLRKQPFPVWMQEPNEDVPNCKVFPYKKLTERFGPNKARGLTNWFTSSPAWMFAFAIERGYKTIGVFGVDMAAAEEHYTGQKAGLLRWFEIGRSLGIKVIVPLESTLAFDYPLYGYAEASRIGRSIIVRETELKVRSQQLQQSIEAQMRDLHAVRGALDQITFDRRTYPTNDMMPELDDEEKAAGVGELGLPTSQPLLTHPPLTQFTAPPSAEDFSNSPEAAELLPKKHGKANGPLLTES